LNRRNCVKFAQKMNKHQLKLCSALKNNRETILARGQTRPTACFAHGRPVRQVNTAACSAAWPVTARSLLAPRATHCCPSDGDQTALRASRPEQNRPEQSDPGNPSHFSSPTLCPARAVAASPQVRPPDGALLATAKPSAAVPFSPPPFSVLPTPSTTPVTADSDCERGWRRRRSIRRCARSSCR
jgi:hypothetical protein